MNMTNIKDFDPDFLINDEFALTKDGSIVFDISYCEESNKMHIGCNDTVCIF